MGGGSGIQKFGQRDGEWRRGSPDSFVCSLMKTETPFPSFHLVSLLLSLHVFLESEVVLLSVMRASMTGFLFFPQSQHFTWCGEYF